MEHTTVPQMCLNSPAVEIRPSPTNRNHFDLSPAQFVL